MWTFSHQSPGYFSIRPVCLRVPNFKYFVLTNRKHKFSPRPRRPSIGVQKIATQARSGAMCPMWEPRAVPDHARMPRLQASFSWKAWVPPLTTFAVLAIHRFLGGAEALQQRLRSLHWYESRWMGRPLHQIGSCTCAHHRLGSQTATNAVSRVLNRLCHCIRSRVVRVPYISRYLKV